MQISTYGITRVFYAGPFITSATLRRKDAKGEVEELCLDRHTLLKTVKDDGPVVTLQKRPNGSWEPMDSVDLLTVDGIQYIKCINDGFACDDLGDVPTGAPP